MISRDDPRVSAMIRDLHRQAVDAGADDPIFGALAIAAMALVCLEDEAPQSRHPRGCGRGSGQVRQ